MTSVPEQEAEKANGETDIDAIIGADPQNLEGIMGSIDGLMPDLLEEPNTLAGEGDLGLPNAIPETTDFSLNMPALGGPEQSEEDMERERMQLLVSHFDEQQMSRYAAFRRANIRRAAVRKYASQLLNQPISNNVAVVLAGMSKVLIGDIIELARDLQEKEQAAERKQLGLPPRDPASEPEPLLPSYIREAWRIYKQETGTVPGSKTKPGSANRFF